MFSLHCPVNTVAVSSPGFFSHLLSVVYSVAIVLFSFLYLFIFLQEVCRQSVTQNAQCSIVVKDGNTMKARFCFVFPVAAGSGACLAHNDTV